MAFDSVQIARLGGAWQAMGALAASDGTVNHRWLQRLARTPEPLRDLADAAHYLCLLHGRHPGVVDFALDHAHLPGEHGWLETAAEAFVTERAYLVRLVAAAGPLPSTPGQAEAEAAAAAQRHALDMLAQSDRSGCASGAAFALALDWLAIRPVLDSAAERLGLTPPPCGLPLSEETVTVVDALAREPSVERAMLFGAQQLFAQHRALFDLLEVRASARAHH
ncbi:hypothetical protein [Sphingomonas sp.]|uniref:DUF6975 family protein n=1 Tax=Sphingomonas sp. TaxID=28214 RepID=UPI001AFE3C21|nr:hypothetical protein [Sphingomonas sp.]MBO9712740.1 hypothetical protein [Sphingomonas sp.]